MKSKLLCLAMVLSASLSASTSPATQTNMFDQKHCATLANNLSQDANRTITNEECNLLQEPIKDSPEESKQKKQPANVKLKVALYTMLSFIVLIVVLTLTETPN